MLQSGSTFLSGKIPRALMHFYWDRGKVAQINADQDVQLHGTGEKTLDLMNQILLYNCVIMCFPI